MQSVIFQIEVQIVFHSKHEPLLKKAFLIWMKGSVRDESPSNYSGSQTERSTWWIGAQLTVTGSEKKSPGRLSAVITFSFACITGQ